MNSEIPNVMKLPPVTVAKASNKQTQEKNPSDIKEKGRTPDGLSLQKDPPLYAVKSNEETDESKRTEAGAYLNPEAIKQAVDEGNSLLQVAKRNLQFKVDDDTSRMVVKVVDSESGELVRQIPAEEVLAVVRRMQEFDQGLLQDRA